MSTVGVKEGAARGTRGLLALVIGLGLLIAAGFVVVVVTLVHRTFGSSERGPAMQGVPHPVAAGAVALDEPPGSRIVSVSALDGRLALLVSGGGVPDRVVLLDARDGSTIATVRLGPAAAVPR